VLHVKVQSSHFCASGAVAATMRTPSSAANGRRAPVGRLTGLVDLRVDLTRMSPASLADWSKQQRCLGLIWNTRTCQQNSSQIVHKTSKYIMVLIQMETILTEEQLELIKSVFLENLRTSLPDNDRYKCIIITILLNKASSGSLYAK